jgi:hypothetical protein
MIEQWGGRVKERTNEQKQGKRAYQLYYADKQVACSILIFMNN